MGAAPRVAVLVPCLDEAGTVGRVVQAFRAALPQAQVHVFDNGSSDATASAAARAGARVQRVALRGKGHVVRRMLADVEADWYLLVDGDDTYDAASAPGLLAAAQEGRHDMLVARRIADQGAWPPGHAWGNRALSGFLAWLFGRSCGDVLSGYRVLSRRYARSFPAHSHGFEIETELTVHALELGMEIAEIPTPYRGRPAGSRSKLRTSRDGLRILATMLRLFAAERPLACFGGLAALLGVAAVLLALPLLPTWLATGRVPRFPTAILATGLMLLAGLSFFSGLVLAALARGRRERKMLAYLRERAPDDAG